MYAPTGAPTVNRNQLNNGVHNAVRQTTQNNNNRIGYPPNSHLLLSLATVTARPALQPVVGGVEVSQRGLVADGEVLLRSTGPQ